MGRERPSRLGARGSGLIARLCTCTGPSLVHGIGTCANYLRKQPRTQDCFRAWQEIYQNKLPTERVAISVKGIVSMSLSSQIKENTIYI